MKLWSGIPLALLTLAPLAGHAASFDCAKAVSAVEKTICRDFAVGRLDERLAERYTARLRAAGSPEEGKAVRQTQRQWLARRSLECPGANAPCLAATYERRLAELGDEMPREPGPLVTDGLDDSVPLGPEHFQDAAALLMSTDDTLCGLFLRGAPLAASVTWPSWRRTHNVVWGNDRAGKPKTWIVAADPDGSGQTRTILLWHAGWQYEFPLEYLYLLPMSPAEFEAGTWRLDALLQHKIGPADERNAPIHGLDPRPRNHKHLDLPAAIRAKNAACAPDHGNCYVDDNLAGRTIWMSPFWRGAQMFLAMGVSPSGPNAISVVVTKLLANGRHDDVCYATWKPLRP